jgi:hypothetical protein
LIGGLSVLAMASLVLYPAGGSAADSPAPQLAEVINLNDFFDAHTPASSDELADLSAAQDVVEDLNVKEVANAWVDTLGGIIVGVVSNDLVPTVQADLAQAGINADVEVVDYSQQLLDSIVAGIYTRSDMSEISSVIHDYENNRLILTSRVPVTDDLRARVATAYGSAAVLSDEAWDPAPSGRENDTSPFYAGAVYGPWGGPATCTVAFSWISVSGAARMLTAGHCHLDGLGASAATNYTPTFKYWMGRVIADTVDSGGTVGSNGDLALIDTTTTTNGVTINRSGAPRMWSGGPTSTTSTTIESVDKWTTNGQAVCYSGQRRGVQCGSIDSDGNGGYNFQDKDWSYKQSTGRVWNNLALATKGWGRCVQPGDSGSPVYINTAGAGVAAHGVLHGLTGSGGADAYVGHFEPANCKMAFTEIGQAYDAWPGGHVEEN